MARRRGQDKAESTLSERQAQIVDVAMRIIATEGARRFTVQLLASEVGVTGGAIYRHFASMEAIVDAVVDRMGSILFERFPPKAPDPIERLRLFFHDRSQAICDNAHVSRLLLSDNLAQACGSRYAEHLRSFKRRSQRFILACLQEAADAGALSRGLSPEVGAIVVLGAIHSLSHLSTRLTTERKTEALAKEVWSAIEHLLRNSDASRRRAEQPRRQACRKQEGKIRKGRRSCR